VNFPNTPALPSRQSDIPRFWAGGGANWNAIARLPPLK
jgi:hypothetical protein